MKDKDLEKAIKNLQKIVDSRRGNSQLEEALKTLEEAKTKAEKEEELDIPLPVLLSTYCGISNGPLGAAGGFVVGKIAEMAASKNEFAANILNGFMGLIHDINKDTKKEKT